MYFITNKKLCSYVDDQRMNRAEAQRSKGQSAECTSVQDLSAKRHLRGDSECEPVVVAPPVGGVAAARGERVAAAAVRGQEERVAAGILDRIVHSHDPPETHGFDLRVREHDADKAAHLRVWLHELASISLLADVLGGASAVAAPQHPLEHRDLGRDAARRHELRREQNALGVRADEQSLRLQAIDPALAGRAVGGHTERDHPVFLDPTAGRLRDNCLAAHDWKDPSRTITRTELCDVCRCPTRTTKRHLQFVRLANIEHEIVAHGCLPYATAFL